MNFRRGLASLLLALAWSATAVAEHALHESEAKAAVLYNFLHYVDWPSGSNAGELHLCMVGKSIAAVMIRQFHGLPVKQRTLAVLPLDGKLSNLHRCAAVFVESADPYDLQRVVSYARDKPVLVVAEGGHAPELGATIGIMVAGGKISFAVNLEAARASGLTISSKLLRLARSVTE